MRTIEDLKINETRQALNLALLNLDAVQPRERLRLNAQIMRLEKHLRNLLDRKVKSYREPMPNLLAR